MIPHQPKKLPSTTQFTFSNPTQKLDEEYNTWAQKIKDQHNYFGKPGNVKLGAWTRRAEEKEEFKWLVKREADSSSDESDTPSPELWKHRETPTVRSAESSPKTTHGSRAQTIAKYRQEMLELARGMPEATYELSLRDIVESPKITTPLQMTVEENLDEGEKKKKKKKKKKERRISRSESMDTGSGLLLKMFVPRIPSFFGGRLSSGNSAEACAKVSPKPMLGDAEKSGSENSTDREWWSSSSGSGGSSSSSSSSRRRSG